jgi:hypothetical protein
MNRLTLSQAISDGRLSDFIAQAEAEGIGPADRTAFENLLGRVTAPLPEDQTSRSPARGSKRGK